MYTRMKTLISLVTLISIVATYIFSASLYLQDQFFFSYSLVLTSVLSLTFWIRSNDLLHFLNKRA
jgi:NADH:ubiquinone oxidoreductase subunit 2 (subunit N)